jgi:hypothetical protein
MKLLSIIKSQGVPGGLIPSHITPYDRHDEIEDDVEKICLYYHCVNERGIQRFTEAVRTAPFSHTEERSALHR